MKYRQILYTVLLGCALSGLFPLSARGIVLTGHFPVQQGRFWNFTTSGSTELSTWAVNGNFMQRGVGDVFVLMQDDGRFLCLRSEWKGLTVYGEYGPEGYLIPEKPLLFLPREMDIDKPVSFEVDMRVYSMPPGGGTFRETGKRKRGVTFRLKSIEDMTVGSRSVRNCVVLEKTVREEGVERVETLWLVPTMGPLKRSVKTNAHETVYTLSSYAGPGIRRPQRFDVEAFFPLRPGSIWTYTAHDGKTCTISTQDNVTVDGLETTPYVVSIPKTLNPNDAFYYAHTPEGLVLPQIYRSAMQGCTVFYHPYSPVTVLPKSLVLGERYSSTSYPKICRWPSRTPSLDYFPEMQYVSIPVVIEDVTVPAGIFKDCLKIALFSISRSFNFKMEKIRTGYIWLSKDKGMVKQELIQVRNYFLPQRIHEISGVNIWDLAKLELPKPDNG